jgi:hypothetical protein
MLLSVCAFPIPAAQLTRVRRLIAAIIAAWSEPKELHVQTFITLEHLHLMNGPARLAENGRNWLPEVGLSVRPDRDPPTFWTKEYLESLTEGQEPRNLIDQVFRVTAGPAMQIAARDEMLGLGTVVQMFGTEDIIVFLQRAREMFLSRIEEPGLRGAVFYMPLMNAATFAAATRQDMESWSCGAGLYVRESVEDGAILIAAKEPLAPILEKLGGTLDASSGPVWLMEKY